MHIITQHRIFDFRALSVNSGDTCIHRKYVVMLRVDVVNFNNTIYNIVFSTCVISNRVVGVKFKVLVINKWSSYSCTAEKSVLGKNRNSALAASVSS